MVILSILLEERLTGITHIKEDSYLLHYRNHRFARAFLGYCVVNKALKELLGVDFTSLSEVITKYIK